MKLLPLEELLRQQLDASKDAMPVRSVGYWERYTGLLAALKESVYPHVNAGLACLSESSGIYTDHGPEHFDEVVRYAGNLLGLDSMPPNLCPLKPYELYLLLCAIRLHDAGNIDGRDAHEKRVAEMLHAYGGSICNDTAEASLISKIAEAHGGFTLSGDKDTIGELPNDGLPVGAITCRPRQVAALVRFADEICEHRSRAAQHHINQNTLPDANKLFHYYADSITGAVYDFEMKRFHLRLRIKTKYLTCQYEAPSRESEVKHYKYLIDEVLDRVDKLDCERRYCNMYLDPGLRVREIQADIALLGDEPPGGFAQEMKNYKFRIPPKQGYPEKQGGWRQTEPDLTGEILVQKIEGGWK